MLRELSIRNILLIERLDLEIEPGLNALTGETGAGKSILLDCLGFVLGWRGRADIVRVGADRGEVSAVFDLADEHPAHEVLEAADIPFDGELHLRRTVTPDGRKRAFANDTRVTGETLRLLSDTLVELHGQHDDKGLLNARNHLFMLDAFAGLDAVRQRCGEKWTALREARHALEKAERDLEEARAEADYLTYAVKELKDLDPQPGEDASLDERRRLLRAAEKIRDDVQRAAQAIGSEGAQGQALDAIRWLEKAAPETGNALDDAMAALSRSVSELAEAERGVEDMLRALTGSTGELETTEERLFAIRGLARKHGVAADDLAGFANEMVAKLDAIEAGDAGLAALRDKVEAALAAYTQDANGLSEKRAKAAQKLDRAMGAELAPLKMDRAVFSTVVAAAEEGPTGADAVSFRAATNPGAPAGALEKVASGGELSRFLLALKVCLAGATDQTLIFDEIDRGVGGATADAVGKRLAELSQAQQLLVVTHSPQVAARAQHQWRVEKSVSGQSTTTSVVPLDAGERVTEIARMLAGENISEEAKSAARVLLET